MDFFALGGEKQSKYDKRTLFWDIRRSLDLPLNPQPTKDAYMRFWGLLEIRTKLIKFQVEFLVKQAKFAV